MLALYSQNKFVTAAKIFLCFVRRNQTTKPSPKPCYSHVRWQIAPIPQNTYIPAKLSFQFPSYLIASSTENKSQEQRQQQLLKTKNLSYVPNHIPHHLPMPQLNHCHSLSGTTSPCTHPQIWSLFRYPPHRKAPFSLFQQPMFPRNQPHTSLSPSTHLVHFLHSHQLFCKIPPIRSSPPCFLSDGFS